MITKIADDLHAMKYRSKGESFRDSMHRVASGMSDSPEHFRQLQDMLLNSRFLPAGRIQASIGAAKDVTPFNCFVSGPIADSFTTDEGSIMQRAAEAAMTMRAGGGIGYDFSTLRPRHSLIKGLQSNSSGPVSFMSIFDAIGQCVASSGHRRGAQMGVMRIDHPDIVEFINVKHNTDKLTGFNLSVAVTDEFMKAVRDREQFDLKFEGKVYATVSAVSLWETLMRSTWEWSEPGVLFIDHINYMNNLHYCETISATNPCGEQPLPPYGACLLGSFNLVQYLSPEDYSFNYEALDHDVYAVVRAYDNIIDNAKYPLEEQRVEAVTKRRIGLGVTGLANAFEAAGSPYGSSWFVTDTLRVMSVLANAAYKASALLAKERGPFALYDAAAYAENPFIKLLDESTQELIKAHGLRNSHLTSIAPTGTISMCADNVSSGIEPVFAYRAVRSVRTVDGEALHTVEDYGSKFLQTKGKLARDVTAQEHIKVLAAAQKYVDSAVSKTCTVSSEMPWADFENLYMSAWFEGAKGCTTFNIGGRRAAQLESADCYEAAAEAAAEAVAGCSYNSETGVRECD